MMVVGCCERAPCDDRGVGGISSDDDKVGAEVFDTDGRIGNVDREPHEAEKQSRE